MFSYPHTHTDTHTRARLQTRGWQENSQTGYVTCFYTEWSIGGLVLKKRWRADRDADERTLTEDMTQLLLITGLINPVLMKSIFLNLFNAESQRKSLKIRKRNGPSLHLHRYKVFQLQFNKHRPAWDIEVVCQSRRSKNLSIISYTGALSLQSPMAQARDTLLSIPFNEKWFEAHLPPSQQGCQTTDSNSSHSIGFFKDT